MSPLSGLVLGSAAIVSSPAWWSSLVAGEQSIDHAVVRFAVAVVVCWGGLSLVASTAFQPPPPERPPVTEPPTGPGDAAVPPEPGP